MSRVPSNPSPLPNDKAQSRDAGAQIELLRKEIERMQEMMRELAKQSEEILTELRG